MITPAGAFFIQCDCSLCLIYLGPDYGFPLHSYAVGKGGWGKDAPHPFRAYIGAGTQECEAATQVFDQALYKQHSKKQRGQGGAERRKSPSSGPVLHKPAGLGKYTMPQHLLK